MSATDILEFLLPCPCCGSPAVILTPDFIKIACTNCCLCTLNHSIEYRQEMIDDWNTRNGKLEVK